MKKNTENLDILNMLATTEYNLFGDVDFESLAITNYALTQNPNPSDIIYSVMLMMIMFSVSCGSPKLDSDINQNLSDNKVDTIDNFLLPDGPVCSPDILDKIYDVEDEDFVQKFVDDNFFDIIVGLAEFETWIPVPTLLWKNSDREGYTLGLSWVYKKEKGKYVQYPCNNEHSKYAKSIMGTPEEWNQIRQHLYYRGEGVYKIQQAIKKISQHDILMTNKDLKTTKISAQKLIALTLIAYQRPGDAVQIIKKLAYATTEQEIFDAFLHYNGNPGDESGSIKRRWMAAMYYTGQINTDDIMQMKIDDIGSIKLNSIACGTQTHTNGLIDYTAIITPEAKKAALEVLYTNKVGNKKTVQEFISTRNGLQKQYQQYMKRNNNSPTKAETFKSARKKILQKRPMSAHQNAKGL